MMLPIKKTILASLAFIVMHWKKIIEISIIPLILTFPLLLILDELMELSLQLLNGGIESGVVAPQGTLLYMALFLYGYALLSVNLARLVMLGADSVSALSGTFLIGKNAKYIGLTMLVGFAVFFPVMLTGSLPVQLIVYFLIVPLTLNFINIALDRSLNFRWSLPFVAHASLFFMQVLLPTFVVLILGVGVDYLGLSNTAILIAQVLIFYWSGINLAFCYRLIVADSSTQNP